MIAREPSPSLCVSSEKCVTKHQQRGKGGRDLEKRGQQAGEGARTQALAASDGAHTHQLRLVVRVDERHVSRLEFGERRLHLRQLFLSLPLRHFVLFGFQILPETNVPASVRPSRGFPRLTLSPALLQVLQLALQAIQLIQQISLQALRLLCSSRRHPARCVDPSCCCSRWGGAGVTRRARNGRER